MKLGGEQQNHKENYPSFILYKYYNSFFRKSQFLTVSISIALAACSGRRPFAKVVLTK